MGHTDTVVLGEGYLDKPRETPSAPPDKAASQQQEDTISTRIISQELRLEGVKFQWWAVGEHPALVTVRSPLFGSLAEFTRGNPAEFAMALAKKLLTQQYERAAVLRASKEAPVSVDSARSKPGWFQV